MAASIKERRHVNGSPSTGIPRPQVSHRIESTDSASGWVDALPPSALDAESHVTSLTPNNLFIQSRIRSLFDFEQDGVFIHPETVAAAD